jgi:hypothetical protein
VSLPLFTWAWKVFLHTCEREREREHINTDFDEASICEMDVPTADYPRRSRNVTTIKSLV